MATSTLLNLTSPTHVHLRCTYTASMKPPPCKFQASALPSRRQSLILLTTSTALSAVELQAKAEDIGLFGLRKKLKKVEEEAEEIVKEGIEGAEKGIESAEKGIESVEKGIESAAESEIEAVAGFGNVAQAAVVVGAEVVGVLVATSVVNGILGPEGQRS